MITRDDLTITLGTSKWGGPSAHITHVGVGADGQPFFRSYDLRSTQGLEQLERIKDRPEVHVFDDGERWHGAFRTGDIDDAIDGLVEHLRELAAQDAVSWATMGPLSDLREAITAFDESLSQTIAPSGWRDRWSAVKDALVAVEVAIETSGVS